MARILSCSSLNLKGIVIIFVLVAFLLVHAASWGLVVLLWILLLGWYTLADADNFLDLVTQRNLIKWTSGLFWLVTAFFILIRLQQDTSASNSFSSSGGQLDTWLVCLYGIDHMLMTHGVIFILNRTSATNSLIDYCVCVNGRNSFCIWM